MTILTTHNITTTVETMTIYANKIEMGPGVGGMIGRRIINIIRVIIIIMIVIVKLINRRCGWWREYNQRNSIGRQSQNDGWG